MLTDTADDDKPVNQSTYQLVNQHVKELQNLGATYNVALFFSFFGPEYQELENSCTL